MLVLGIGLTVTLQDALMISRHLGKLLRVAVAMNVVVPAFAVVEALAFELHATIEIALVVIALWSVPSFLPMKTMREGPSPIRGRPAGRRLGAVGRPGPVGRYGA